MISDRYMMDCAALAFNTPGITPAFSKGLHASVTVEHLHHFARLVTDAATASLHARIAELEAQLYAVGAGGVGESIKPQVQADAAPAAWVICSDDGTAIRLWSRDKATAQDAADKFGLPLVPLYAAPQPTENLKCKSTQKRLATLWGYEKARQPLTDERILSIVRAAPALDTVEAEFLHIVRAVEFAHGITRGQQ